MKTRLLIIMGLIATILVILLAYYGTSENLVHKEFQEKRELFMNSHGLHNLNSTERDEFITEYTNAVHNGEFYSQVYITDLQNEYAIGEPITFTVATWGYGHPCQSPSFVYYYETKDPANIVFEDEYQRLCQVLEESDYTNYYQELGSNRTDKALNDDVFPVFDKPGSYIVSIDDKAEYEFQIIKMN